MPTGPLPGFRDFYPPSLADRAYIFGTWRDVARRYAFVEYDGPPLEPTELYTKKSGDEIVGQLYNFTDKGEREIALRPEMTPTLARMVAAQANALRKPVRWFSIPQLFRYERQQRGRLREHFQLNVDIVGETDVAADAELVACATDAVRAFGLTRDDIVVRFSDRRLLNAYLRDLGIADHTVPAAYAVLDKWARQPESVSIERLIAGGATPEQANRLVATAHMIRDQPGDAWLDGLAGKVEISDATRQAWETVQRYQRYAANLLGGAPGEWLTFDLSIVRGLAYYTGIVFEIFDRRGELRAVCGGGRYDTLLQTLGGVDLPALGFGMGDVVLTELLRGRGLLRDATPALDYWVAGDDASLTGALMTLAHDLRERGRSVEYALRPQTLARQLKAASAAGARRVVILRRDRLADGVVTVRDLADGAEETVSVGAWLPRA
jgi:histidyl-tRNA synthetase